MQLSLIVLRTSAKTSVNIKFLVMFSNDIKPTQLLSPQELSILNAKSNLKGTLQLLGHLTVMAVSSYLWSTNMGHLSDRCIYRKVGGGSCKPLTTESAYRYADFVWSRLYGKLICVREDHTAEGEPINTLVAVNTSNGEDIQVLVSGADFYASPCLKSSRKVKAQRVV